ncbi:uncharacterized protein LOC121376253 isoform X3 [Gigantopelta aegis]|uniref:uncharacterized protein LOC121376253 isoform X3 n=1 Tax=Gigantopelta aegis TaxID=1735272 RepID=UPI001B88D9BB|nr:uncharacterized protein LOC121376253 isoform X3 [Gigantopelta aegis]
MTDNEGMTPLDIARYMGNTDIALLVVLREDIDLKSQKCTELNNIGWLKRVLLANAHQPRLDHLIMPQDITVLGDFRKMRPKHRLLSYFQSGASVCNRDSSNRLDLNLPHLLGMKDDQAACAMIEIAQETVIQVMCMSYSCYPLLHLCAIMGCEKSLRLLLQMIKKCTIDDMATWTRKPCHRGKIPLSYAIENQQTECVKILFAEDDCLDWVSVISGETILHHVAKTDNKEISQLITPRATDAQLCLRDKNNCTPAAVCVALGNHSVVTDMLRGIVLDSVEHTTHTETDFSCVDCLFDRCIGWSRMILQSTDISNTMPYRDVMKRKPFIQGYTTDGAGKRNHPLTNLLAWSMMSPTSNVLDRGLAAMRYDSNTPAAHLFVLLNMHRRKDVEQLIYKALSCGFDAAACYLFKQNVDELSSSVDEFCLKAIACHSNTFFSMIISETNVLEKSLTPTALDVAFGFGNFEAVKWIEEANGDIDTDRVKTLVELADVLPLSIRWRIGVAQPGDDEWINSVVSQTQNLTDNLPKTYIQHEDRVIGLVVSQTQRISEPEALLCMRPDDHFRQILENLPIRKESFLPQTFLEKDIQVDMKSFEFAGLKCDIKGIWLYSIILSKLIMGRYHLEINLQSAQWKAIKTIVISCVQDASSEVPEMKLLGNELHDKVRFRKTHASEGEGHNVVVDTADIQVIFSHEETMKTTIQEKVIPQLESLIKDKLMGQTIKIEVDWGSIDAAKDRQCRQHIFMVLAGEHGGNRLGGLETMILRSGSLLDSIADLGGPATAKRAIDLIATIKNIVVRYVEVFPTSKRIILSSSDSKIFWYFSLKDLTLHYMSSLFAIYKSLKGYHSACYSLADCILAIKDNCSKQLDDDNEQSKDKYSKSVDSPFELHVDVRSFEEAGISESIDIFFQNKVAHVMRQLGSAYKFLLRFEMNVIRINVLAIESKDKSGISFKDRILTISLKMTRPMDGAWQIDDLDFYKIFTDMEVKQIKDRYACDELIEKVIQAGESFQKLFGLPLDISFNPSEWLEDVVRIDNREMTHPFDLLTTYVEVFADQTLASYEDALMQELTTADCWLLEKIQLPCGFWSTFNYSELKGVPETKTMLVKYRHVDENSLEESQSNEMNTSLTFDVLTHVDIQKLDKASVVGLWYLVPADQVTKYDNVQLLSLRDRLFYIPDRRFGSRFISGLKNKIEICSRYVLSKEKAKHAVDLSFDDIIRDKVSQIKYSNHFKVTQILCCKNAAVQKAAKHFSSHAKPLTVEGYMLYNIWVAASNLGINIVFDLHGFKQTSSVEVVADVLLMTLNDISSISMTDKQIHDSFLDAVSKLGTVSIGFDSDCSIRNKEMGKVEGSTFSEMADITFVSQRDLHINFRPAILVSDQPLQPITDTIRSALCKSFQVQAPQEVVQIVSDVLNISMSVDSTIVPKFYLQKNNVEILHAVSTLMSNFDQAMQHIVKNHNNARMRLQSELTSVVFTESALPLSTATFTEGMLQCTLFKGGNTVTAEELQTDILAALEYPAQSPEEPRFKSKLSPLQLVNCPDGESVLTVTCQKNVKRQRRKLQRLKRPKGTSSIAVDNATERLFYHVELGQTGNIENELDIGADINRRGEEGATPFLRSCQLRNYVVQKVLLRRGANVNKSDKLHRTPLHYEAAHGDVESLTLLLTHKAKVNVRDKYGRTPLHYAVNNSHFEAADLLVFCGADGTIMDKTMQSPASHCRHPWLRKLMMESQLTVHGIKHGYIQIEHVTLEADMSYHLSKIGLTMRTPSSVGSESVSMVWRRVQPEYSRTDMVPADKELLMSDIFEYRMSGTDVTEGFVLKIPIYSKPDRFEEVYMKTDRDEYIGRLQDIREEKMDQWVCYIKVNPSSMNAFVLVTLPKKEIFPVTSSGGTFSSNVAQVEILVKPDTFERPGDLTLEIIPKPAIDEEEFDKVLSLSHFFNISHAEGEQPQKEVIMTIPLPHDYFGDGDLYVMMRHEDDNCQVEQDLWEILEKNPAVHNGLVNVNVRHFSECNLLEYRDTFEDITLSETEKTKVEREKETEIIRLNAKLLEKAQRRECNVVFVAMLKPLPDSVCEAVIECTRNNHLGQRLKYWKNEGYKDQNPSFTSDFVTFPKQEFKLDIGGNAKKLNPVITTLQYHPKRQNVLKLPISLHDQLKDNVGWVDIAEKQDSLEEKFESQPDYDSLAKILLHYFPFDGQGGNTNNTESITEEEKAFEGFTDESLLNDLARDLGSEWRRVAMLLGFSDRSLKMQQDKPEETAEEQRYRLLRSWRDSRLRRRDHGVPELLIALQKGGRKDLVRKVIQTLELWLGEKKERRDNFVTWLKAALSGTTTTHEALLKPMSDVFSTSLVQRTTV